ncbi:MAG: hypothetical protein F4056_04310, partial [Chloroflexi bacterium]|nr:hypothetical protein [Chloroflexota bacterium]
ELYAEQDESGGEVVLPLLGRFLSKPLLRAGRAIDYALRNRGIGDSEQLAADLETVESTLTVPAFRGQQLMQASITGSTLPVLNLIGINPFGPWPWPLWLVLAAGGWVLPIQDLRSKLAKRREMMQLELSSFVNLLVLHVSAGHTLDTALKEVAPLFAGPLGVELRRIAVEAETSGRPFEEGLRDLANRTRISALQQISTAWENQREFGTSVSDTLRYIGVTLRQEETLAISEHSARAQTKMMLLLGGTIFPAFLIMVLYPLIVSLFASLRQI